MKCFFGEWRKDGQPIDREALRTMAAAVPWYGEDGEGFWSSTRVGIGAVQTFDTPESRYETAITASADNLHVLAGSYRIDNRDELIALMDVAAPAGRPITDAEVILAAYAQWGDKCPKQLIGDFAFVLWDEQRHVLMLVRDHIGIVPFYYYRADWGLLFSNDLHALMAHPRCPRELNPTAIIYHLRDLYYVMPEDTFWRDVSKLLPAHVLTASDGQQAVRAYWSPRDVAMVDLVDGAAYAGRVRELLEQSIKSRLRTLHPVGAHLSGGLDSTAIAVLAQRYLSRTGIGLAGVYTWLSAMETEADECSPEYAALKTAECLLGLKAETVELSGEALDRELVRNVGLEGYSDLWVESLVRQKARGRHIKTLLTGWGGDQIVSSGIHGYLAELFWSGRWAEFFKMLWYRFGGLGTESSSKVYLKALRQRWFLLYHEVFLASVPYGLYQWILKRTRPPIFGFDTYEICNASGIFPDNNPPQYHDQRRRTKRAEMERKILAGELQARIEACAAQGAKDGIQYIYPLLDLRLLEFCLGVPAEHYVNDEGRSRCLFLAAMDDVLSQMGNVKGFKVRRKVGEPLSARRLREVIFQWAIGHLEVPLPQGQETSYIMGWFRRMQVVTLGDFVESRNGGGGMLIGFLRKSWR